MRLMCRALLMAMVTLWFAACASAPPEPSLYQRLGGRESIKLVVDDFVANMAADPRVNGRFKDLDAGRVA
jgi:hemoglobin